MRYTKCQYLFIALFVPYFAVSFISAPVLCGQTINERYKECQRENERLRKELEKFTGKPEPPPVISFDAATEHAKLLKNMAGYASSGKTVGGKGGILTVVSNVRELEAALEDYKKRIIVFSESAHNKIWDVYSDIKPRHYKTVWGITEKGQEIDITLRSRYRGTGGIFRINREHFILAGVRMTCGDPARNDNAPDMIHVSNYRGNGKVWVYNCKFDAKNRGRDVDGVLDCYGRDCTLQKCIILNWEKPCLVRGRGELSIIDCVFDRCGGRFPHCKDGGEAHTHNCTIKNWHWNYAIRSESRNTYVTNTTFENTDKRKYAILGRWYGHSNIFNGSRYDKPRSSRVRVPYDY